ncbi:MAG: hypothetical protein ACE5HJ_00320 [Thermoplasmata archaeon]
MRGVYLAVVFASVILLVGAGAAQPPFEPPFGAEWRKEALDLAQSVGMFGPLSFEGGVLEGAFVEAEMLGTDGSLASFSIVRDGVSTEVFAQVEVEGTTETGAWALAPEESPALLFEGTDVSVSIHNNPSRALVYRSMAQQLSITFTAAPGVFFALQSDSVLVSGTGFSGQLATPGSSTTSVEPNVVRVGLSQGSVISFRAHPADDEGAVGSWAQATVFNALARQRLGAELFLVAFEGGIMEDAVLYSDISVKSSLDAAGNVEVTISRDSQTAVPSPGIVVAINLHHEVLKIADMDRLSVELDGNPVERTNNADEIPSSSSSSPRYYAATGPNGIIFLVYIPELSTKILTIGELLEGPIRELTPGVIMYVLLGVAVTAAASAAIFRRGKGAW